MPNPCGNPFLTALAALRRAEPDLAAPDLAERLGVSVALVSLCLKGDLLDCAR
jgi:hypothetical protein